MKLAKASLQGVREVNVARSCHNRTPEEASCKRLKAWKECGGVHWGEAVAERGWRAEEQFYLEKARRV